MFKNLIAGQYSAEGYHHFQAVNPSTQEVIETRFCRATKEEIEQAVQAAKKASTALKNMEASKKAAFLRLIADNIMELGDTLVQTAMQESGLPQARIVGERGRTCNQLRLFADLVEEGSWVDARIEEALPDRVPARNDIRLMKRAVGPVVVFTASNFPLAFSTAGGDTASAFAAGCPVIVKAHPAHPSTNAMVSHAITQAITQLGFPAGSYSSLYDDAYEVGAALVLHPAIKSVAFTGSHRGGLALHQLAQQRPQPIPVFAEMGSVNPVCILDDYMETHLKSLAKTIAHSANMGAGQFCTNPGIQIITKKHAEPYLEHLSQAFKDLTAFTMLTGGIFENYQSKRNACLQKDGVQNNHASPFGASWKASPAVAHVEARDFIQNPSLQEEIFGPFSLVVICENTQEMEVVVQHMEGQLTATLFGTEAELVEQKALSLLLEERVGRLIYNGVPTGVEVCHAMQHGGPFPASTDDRFTSVGTNAIYRFVRPVCFQDCPDALLPPELKHSNPMKISRLVNGKRVES